MQFLFDFLGYFGGAFGTPDADGQLHRDPVLNDAYAELRSLLRPVHVLKNAVSGVVPRQEY